MVEAKDYRRPERLKNGTAVTIRAVRPDDKKRFAEAFKNLESESVYTRFFRYKSELTDEELKARNSRRSGHGCGFGEMPVQEVSLLWPE